MDVAAFKLHSYEKHGFDKYYSVYGMPFLQSNCDSEYFDDMITHRHYMKENHDG